MKHYASRLDFWATMYGEAKENYGFYHGIYKVLPDNAYIKSEMRYKELSEWIKARMERAMK